MKSVIKLATALVFGLTLIITAGGRTEVAGQSDTSDVASSPATASEWIVTHAASTCVLDLESGKLVLEFAEAPKTTVGFTDRPEREARRLDNTAYTEKIFKKMVQEESPPNAVLTGAPLSAEGALISGGMTNMVFSLIGVEVQTQDKVVYTLKQSGEQAAESFLIPPPLVEHNGNKRPVTLAGCGLTIDNQAGKGILIGCCS